MRFAWWFLVVCACGRLHFEHDDTVLTITSPAESAQVDASATLTGTCRADFPVDIAGDVRATAAGCNDNNTFSVEVLFTDGDGVKLVTASQGPATDTRSFVRVTPGLRTASAGVRESAGFMVDCDLTIDAPAGVVARDVIVGVIFTDGGPQGAIGTSGWTRLALSNSTSVGFFKVATDSEPATYTFPIVAGIDPVDSCESAGVLAAFKGVHLAAPILAESKTTGSSTNLVAPGLFAVEGGLLVVAYGSNGPAEGIEMPAALLAAQTARSPGGFANAAIGYVLVGEGPTGDRTATIPVERDVAAAQILLDTKP